MRYERDLIDEVLVHIPHQRIARARHLERQAAGLGTRQRDMEREMLGHHGDLIWTAADKLTREMHAHVDIVRTSPPPAANLTPRTVTACAFTESRTGMPRADVR